MPTISSCLNVRERFQRYLTYENVIMWFIFLVILVSVYWPISYKQLYRIVASSIESSMTFDCPRVNTHVSIG